MIELDFSRCKMTPKEHQVLGVKMLCRRPYFALFDEVGAGKSKQVVDAVHFMHEANEIDTAVVFTPGFARSVWLDPDPVLGEVAKHAWDDVNNIIHEYHSHSSEIDWVPRSINWVVSNYEFIRREDRLVSLMKQLAGRKVWLILDEAWAIKGRSSDQTRACLRLRRKLAKRVVILNGTPLADGSPGDLYSQMNLLDPSILNAPNWTTFRARYAIMGGFMNKQIVEWQRLDELNALIAPHVLARKTRDFFDLPEAMPPILVEARLTPRTWNLYKQMRDELVAWFDANKGQASVARQGIVRSLRLAQITSGFLGGIETIDDDLQDDLPLDEDRPSWLPDVKDEPSEERPSFGMAVPGAPVQEIGTEKLEALLRFLENQRKPHKLLVWCRFRPEIQRTAERLQELYPSVHMLWGKQKKADRVAAKHALAPGGNPGSAAVVGQQQAGGASLNFSAASMAIYMSNDCSLKNRVQSWGRIERPGQMERMQLVDVVAVGPKGQKTIDHVVLSAIRRKDDMARWSVDEWRRKLLEE